MSWGGGSQGLVGGLTVAALITTTTVNIRRGSAVTTLLLERNYPEKMSIFTKKKN